MSLPAIKLNQGIHVMHLFYRLDRCRWSGLAPAETARSLGAHVGIMAAISGALSSIINNVAALACNPG